MTQDLGNAKGTKANARRAAYNRRLAKRHAKTGMRPRPPAKDGGAAYDF